MAAALAAVCAVRLLSDFHVERRRRRHVEALVRRHVGREVKVNERTTCKMVSLGDGHVAIDGNQNGMVIDVDEIESKDTKH